MAKLYVCGRCSYRSHHRMRCHSCGFMLEEACGKCHSARGNCVCKFHGMFMRGKKVSTAAAATKRKGGNKEKKVR